MNRPPARVVAAFGLYLLSAMLAAPGCATVGPVVSCLGQNVAPSDVTRIENDLATQNFADLVEEAIAIGWPTVECVIDQRSAARPELRPAAAKFKAQHAREMGHESSNAPSRRRPGTATADTPSDGRFRVNPQGTPSGPG